jgi:folate-dependent phosphoribosylglycinamide formyltransferase PurN
MFFATALDEAGCLTAIVVEQSPVKFVGARARRPSLRTPEGKQWALRQFRANLGIALAVEPLRVVFDQLNWRIASVMEHRFTSARLGDGALFPGQPLRFPDRVPRHEVKDLNDSGSIALLASLSPDICLVVGTRVLSDAVIRIPRRGTINWHPGILPAYRGVYCELFALYNRDYSSIGYTIHYLDTAVDAGDVIWQATIAVGPSDDFHSLRTKNAVHAAKILPDLIGAIEAGTAPRRPQAGPGRQYFMRDVVPAVKIKVILEGFLRRCRLLKTSDDKKLPD